MNHIQKLFSFLLLLVFFSSCGNNNEKEETKSTESDLSIQKEALVTVEIKELKQIEEGCEAENCTMVELNYPQISAENKNLQNSVNEYVMNYLSTLFKESLPEPLHMEDPNRMAESFLEGYKMFRMEFPDMDVPWFIKVDGKKTYETDDYFSLHLSADVFTGGNHPNRFVDLQSFSLESGDTINVLNAINKPEEFKKEAEKAFRKNQNLTDDQSLNEAGYMFDDDQFTLPDNMAFVPGGILLHYNAYEVAPYDMGAIHFIIPINTNSIKKDAV